MKNNTSFYNQEELSDLGFRFTGNNLLISRKASIYSPESISIGDNSRIDDFCILSGQIDIGRNVHISAFSALYGAAGIILEDYSGVSPRCTIFSSSDDFSGNYMVGPLVPKEYTNRISGRVILKKYVQIGAGSIIMPSVIIGEGAATGAFSFISESLSEWGIYTGIPARFKKDRNKGLLIFANKIQK